MAQRQRPEAEIVLVVAAAENGAIGLHGEIPWHIPADLQRFKRMTMGKAIIMGRKTFESIGRPLSGRHNIVLTTASGWTADGVSVAADLDSALCMAAQGPATDHGEIMVIGGGEVYAQALELADRIELTRVHLSPQADRFFESPEPSVWQQTSNACHAAEAGRPAYSFQSYVRADQAN